MLPGIVGLRLRFIVIVAARQNVGIDFHAPVAESPAQTVRLWLRSYVSGGAAARNACSDLAPR